MALSIFGDDELVEALGYGTMPSLGAWEGMSITAPLAGRARVPAKARRLVRIRRARAAIVAAGQLSLALGAA